MKTIITLLIITYISGIASARYYYDTAVKLETQFNNLVWNAGIESLESKSEDKRLATLYKAGMAAGAELKRGGV